MRLLFALFTLATFLPSITALGCGRVLQSTLSVNGVTGALSNELLYDQTTPSSPSTYMNNIKLEIGAATGATTLPKFRIAIFADPTYNATANQKFARITIYAPNADTPAEATISAVASNDGQGTHTLRLTANGGTNNGGSTGGNKNNTASLAYTLINPGVVTAASCVAINSLSSIRSTSSMLSCLVLSSFPLLTDAQPTRPENECTGNEAITIVVLVGGVGYVPATTLPTGSAECNYGRDETYGKTECTWANQPTPAAKFERFSLGNETNSFYGALSTGVYRSISRTEVWGTFYPRTFGLNITKLEYAFGTNATTSINDIVDWTVSDLSLFTDGSAAATRFTTYIPSTIVQFYGGWYMKPAFSLPYGDLYVSLRMTTSDNVVQPVFTNSKPLTIISQA